MLWSWMAELSTSRVCKDRPHSVNELMAFVHLSMWKENDTPSCFLVYLLYGPVFVIDLRDPANKHTKNVSITTKIDFHKASPRFNLRITKERDLLTTKPVMIVERHRLELAKHFRFPTLSTYLLCCKRV